jgi:hypothetical protein
VFNGQMITFCDRTGKIFEIAAEVSESESGWVPRAATCTALRENNGTDAVVIKGGDGSSGSKPFKTEW